MALRERAGTDDVPLDGKALGAAGDAAAQAWLAAALAEHRPADAVLSEEAKDDPARLGAGRVWIIDPLDGTREFAEIDPDGTRRTDFAVHVALWERGRGLVAGAVALPGRGRVFDSARPSRPSRTPVRGPSSPGSGRCASRRRGRDRPRSSGGSPSATTWSSWPWAPTASR